MALTTGPIENIGNQPANANRVVVKILNRTSGPISGLLRSVKLNGTRVLIEQDSYNVPANASAIRSLTLVHPTLGQAPQYELVIIPDQNGGIFSVYGVTAANVIIDAQRVLNSELTTTP